MSQFLTWNNRALVAGAAVIWAALSLSLARADDPAAAAKPAAPATAKDEAALEARIVALIAQLGAEDFALREKAQAELAQLGLAAFDALHTAQDHNDPEIALRARYLVRSMSVRWFQESDSPEVVVVLRGYGDLSEPERKNRMDRLALLANGAGIPALCRLSRFETVETLSKYAALKILEQPLPKDPAVKSQLQEVIASVVGGSKRSTAVWMRLYAKTLGDPAAALAEWDEATKAEAAVLEKNPDHTHRDIVRDLYRFQVQLLKDLKRDDEAIAVTRRTFSLLDGTTEQVTEVADWLVQRQAWQVVLELSERFEGTFQDNPLLLYRLAETHLKLQQPEKAAEIAAKALELKPENPLEHIRTGYVLQEERGLVEWAEREYREVIKNSQVGAASDFSARFRLSELLHDLAQELPAAETLQPVCDLMAKDEAVKQTCARLRDPAGVISRMNYFYAMQAHAAGDAAKERQYLQTAIDSDPTDADVLIAMYRLPGADDAWKKSTAEKIASTAAEFRNDVDGMKQVLEMTTNEQQRDQVREQLALACNQYAWLVGNTTGNYDDAIKLSHLSLEMQPNYAGYLDTLGRCYYTKGDLENAVKYQSEAVKFSPFSGQIRRQLELFKKELAAKGAKSP
jgi:tetratricopeptide (TPR) repeat protein